MGGTQSKAIAVPGMIKAVTRYAPQMAKVVGQAAMKAVQQVPACFKYLIGVAVAYPISSCVVLGVVIVGGITYSIYTTKSVAKTYPGVTRETAKPTAQVQKPAEKTLGQIERELAKDATKLQDLVLDVSKGLGEMNNTINQCKVEQAIDEENRKAIRESFEKELSELIKTSLSKEKVDEHQALV